MKKLIVIFILLSLPAHAATFKGCAKSDHGNWECTWNVHIYGIAAPLNNNQDIIFGITDIKTSLKEAKQITQKMAHLTEQPDLPAIQKYVDDKVVDDWDQKLKDQKWASEIHRREILINPDKVIQLGEQNAK